MRILIYAVLVLLGTLGCEDPTTMGGGISPTPLVNNAPADLKPTVISAALLQKFQANANRADPAVSITTAMINLGRMLWYDERLSEQQNISCNSCHNLENYGVDNRSKSIGTEGQVGRRNAPTVYNAAEHFALFWDGRRLSVEEQAVDPILDPMEMGMDPEQLQARLEAVPAYVAFFKKAFPDDPQPISLVNVGSALGAFERGLLTPSRWHRFLAGEQQALNQTEIKGLKVFLELGCTGCHTGPQIGGSLFQRVGLVTPWPNQEDRGRFEVSRQASDAMVFKVPSLINVAKTGPYFHDGSIDDLPTAVRVMARHQLGIELEVAQTTAIVTFLEALTGEVPSGYIARPQLAESVGSQN